MRRLRIRLREGSAYVAADFLPLAANLLGEESFASVDSVLRRLEAKTREILETDPVFLAIEGSFHGKSTGALQLTHRREFARLGEGLGLRRPSSRGMTPPLWKKRFKSPRFDISQLVMKTMEKWTLNGGT